MQHIFAGWRVETNLMGANDSGPEPVVLVRNSDGSPAHLTGHTAIGQAFILPSNLGGELTIEVHWDNPDQDTWLFNGTVDDNGFVMERCG